MFLCIAYPTTYVRYIKCIVYVIFKYLIVILPSIMDIEIFYMVVMQKSKELGLKFMMAIKLHSFKITWLLLLHEKKWL